MPCAGLNSVGWRVATTLPLDRHVALEVAAGNGAEAERARVDRALGRGKAAERGEREEERAGGERGRPREEQRATAQPSRPSDLPVHGGGAGDHGVRTQSNPGASGPDRREHAWARPRPHLDGARACPRLSSVRTAADR